MSGVIVIIVGAVQRLKAGSLKEWISMALTRAYRDLLISVPAFIKLVAEIIKSRYALIYRAIEIHSSKSSN